MEKVICEFCEKELELLFSVKINDDFYICEECNDHMEFENGLTKIIHGGY